MTLNWHDHWATSNDKVGDVKLMMRQQRTLRRYALGNFRTLARAMVRDGAMQIWLDLAGSSDEAPNENFAREFFELFTLGANNGYTEKDIREASRALTGFTFDYDSKRFGFDPKRHDGGTKHILGRHGRFGPLDVVDLALENRHHAPYLCAQLWGYFSPRTCPPRLLRKLVKAYTGVRLRDRARALADPRRRRALRRPRRARHDQAARRLRGRHAAPDRHAHHAPTTGSGCSIRWDSARSTRRT